MVGPQESAEFRVVEMVSIMVEGVAGLPTTCRVLMPSRLNINAQKTRFSSCLASSMKRAIGKQHE